MYKAYFGLQKKPFDLLPDPDFLFLGRSHQRARLFIEHALRERSGFVLLTGEIGAGKTTIIRDMLKNCGPDIVVAKVFNTRVEPHQLLFMINDDFGLAPGTTDKASLLQALNDFLIATYAKGEQAILVIDEAQNLGADALEEVRLLSNLETDSAKLLQIILVGQPELRQIVAAPQLTQLRQRISLYTHISPLEEDETIDYIRCRLEAAGNRDAVDFSPESLAMIRQNSRGIPRLINIICDFCLLFAFSEERQTVDARLVDDVLRELNFAENYWNDTGTAASSSSRSDLSDNAERVAISFQGIQERLTGIENQCTLNAYLFESACKRVEYFDQLLRDHLDQGEDNSGCVRIPT